MYFSHHQPSASKPVPAHFCATISILLWASAFKVHSSHPTSILVELLHIPLTAAVRGFPGLLGQPVLPKAGLPLTAVHGVPRDGIATDGIPADGIPANGIPAALSQGQAIRERAASCMLGSMSSSNAAVTDALPKCCKHMESTSPSQQITLPTHSPGSQQGRGWCSVLPQAMPKILRPRSPQMGAGWVLALLPELHCCGNNHLAL